MTEKGRKYFYDILPEKPKYYYANSSSANSGFKTAGIFI
ncbi:hypothetical protein EV194_101389 [Natronoflexus pectinivorans]|uniref:Uncharacterized protein n=1 Tax=Natronoflexus pectinivorans TaxID=682526 RepID=A0A4R2GNY6_9BACT|nr:hypothetical protein EV194_101389 [Natronoflexus pectinivorans]